MSSEHDDHASDIKIGAGDTSAEDGLPPLSTPKALYRPLSGSEIRLIRLGPRCWNDLVSCELIYVPLDDRPKYIALSYRWGNPADAKTILLNGRAHHITMNLFTGLRRIRYIISIAHQVSETFIIKKLENFYF
jgi:hypothetical protein